MKEMLLLPGLFKNIQEKKNLSTFNYVELLSNILSNLLEEFIFSVKLY